MAGKNDADKILQEFLQTASPEERREVNRLLDERKRNPKNLSQMDLSGSAKSMAEDLQKSMGLTQDNIRRTAIDMVIRLARQHSPEITDAELAVLVKEMVPDPYAQAESTLPPDLLQTMVLQFVTYSLGEMPEHELRELPEGWAQKFWSHFPPPLRNIISDFLKSGTGRREFWQKISEYFR